MNTKLLKNYGSKVAVQLEAQRIEVAYPDKNKIHVFCDNARYYKNVLVQGYPKKFENNTSLFTSLWSESKSH